MLARRITAILLTILIVFNLAACRDTEKKRYEAEFLTLFDTVTRIVGYTDSEEEFTKQVHLIYGNLEEYHQLYDIYNDYPGINNIKTINDQAGIAPVKVDQRIINLLRFSKEVSEMTDGKVNVVFGSVLRIWHDHRTMGIEDPEKATLPSMDQLVEASKHTDINQIIIDENNSTVYLQDSEMSLDVGAIAKGYATEEVSKMALENGFTSALISVGGNVRSIGVKADGDKPWKVGVQNPFDENGENISQVMLKDESLVTSGIYERYFIVGGKSYHHIIDPATLFPADYFVSVTILSQDSGLADALSTSVFNMPFDQGKALIESLPQTEAMWAFQDGTIKYSSHFQESISQ